MRAKDRPVLDAPIALASDGTLLVNVAQLSPGTVLDEILRYAEVTGLPIFIGVAVPGRLYKRFVRELDDAVADVVGRLGPRVTASCERESASSRSSGERASASPGQRAGRVRRPQGRPREP